MAHNNPARRHGAEGCFSTTLGIVVYGLAPSRCSVDPRYQLHLEAVACNMTQIFFNYFGKKGVPCHNTHAPGCFTYRFERVMT